MLTEDDWTVMAARRVGELGMVSRRVSKLVARLAMPSCISQMTRAIGSLSTSPSVVGMERPNALNTALQPYRDLSDEHQPAGQTFVRSARGVLDGPTEEH